MAARNFTFASGKNLPKGAPIEHEDPPGEKFLEEKTSKSSQPRERVR